MAGRRISGSGSRIKSGMTRKSSLARRQSRLRHAQMPCHLSAPAHELRRALGALSIPIDAKALKTLFHEIDSDGSGEISFGELNAVLRRQVDFDNGGGERFDAASGTYTTKATAVRQVKTTSLPAITTSASVVQMEPVIVSVVPTDASKAAKHAANRDRREQQALMQNEGMERRARATRAAHDVP